MLHCLTVVKTLLLVAGTELATAVDELGAELKAQNVRIAFSGAAVPNLPGAHVDAAVAALPVAPPPAAVLNRANMDDVFGYIYTSGTTGLPKAAVIRHWRMFAYGAAAVNCFLVRARTCAPSHPAPHTLTPAHRLGVRSPGHADRPRLLRPAAVPLGGRRLWRWHDDLRRRHLCDSPQVLRVQVRAVKPRRRSAPGPRLTERTLLCRGHRGGCSFWQDVTENKCTVIQYIGELCRYLLAAPPGAYDRKHSVRIAIGNGLRYDATTPPSFRRTLPSSRRTPPQRLLPDLPLRPIPRTRPLIPLSLHGVVRRPDIWNAFQDRFAIPEVGEFYGSTEGNISLVNHATTLADRGAVGRQGWLLRRLFGGRIVKFDVEKEEPVRDKNGRSPHARQGRPGNLADLIVRWKACRPLGGTQGFASSVRPARPASSWARSPTRRPAALRATPTARCAVVARGRGEGGERGGAGGGAVGKEKVGAGARAGTWGACAYDGLPLTLSLCVRMCVCPHMRGTSRVCCRKQANSKKMLTDVFVKGDKYVRTGDLLVLDSNGYFRFVDRIGDTFRYVGDFISVPAIVLRA